MTYAQYSKGFRSGGQNVFLLPGAPVFYDPETLTNYEIGFKSTFWDGRARLNVAAYHMAWKDFQAIVIEGMGGAGEARDNVGDAHSTGVDVEFTIRPVSGLTWTIGGSLLEAETDEDYTIDNKFVPAGTRIPDVSEISFNTALQYNFPIIKDIIGFCRAAYSYAGDAQAVFLNSGLTTPSYQIVNFRAGIEEKNWQLAVFANNIFDEYLYYQKAYAGADLYDGTATLNSVGRPKTIGISLKYNF